MANSGIFCNTPWYELHIYWDGSLGICCQESGKLYPVPDNKYNIANMTISEWFNSPPVQNLRQQILSDHPVRVCSACYHEEAAGTTSRRERSNQKSVIFRQAFDQSFAQSPNRHYFDSSGQTVTQPIDLHIDLGNHCNLACKMCHAQASSKIAVQEVKWGLKSSRQYVGTDWTQNQSVWHNFKNQLVSIDQLKNIHLMGGETMLSAQFEDLVDALTQHERFDVSFSFVTNGTTIKPQLIRKLKQFARVGIEVSIETVTDHNAYVRQGTDTQQVLDNIQWYQTQVTGTNISVTLRPAISLLTIGHYSTLLQHALDHQLSIKSLLVTTPDFLDVKFLPTHVKQQYSVTFDKIIDQLADVDIQMDYNVSDPNNFRTVIKQQALMCKNVLASNTPDDSDRYHQQLANHCKKWDQIYAQCARTLYPELKQIWNNHGY